MRLGKKKLLESISKEDFTSFYLTHTTDETCEHFNIGHANCQTLISEYNLPKTIKEKAMYLFPYEDVYDVYITQNKSLGDCAKHFGIPEHKFRQLISYYNIVKDMDLRVQSCRDTKMSKYENPNYNNVNKIKDTCQEKYGVCNVSQCDVVKEKIKDTWIENYGSLENLYESRKEKSIETCKQRYGVEYVSQCKEFQDKVHQSIIEKYGSEENYSLYMSDKLRKHKLSDTIKPLYYNREKSIEFLTSNKEMTCRELASLFNVDILVIWGWMSSLNLYDYIDTKPQRSHYENELYEWLTSIGVEVIQGDREILKGKEIDLYLPQYAIGIEFNGAYFHSNKFVDKDYHFNKSLMAQENGIRLIHIYDYEWNNPTQRDKIISLLNIAMHRTLTKIYARECEIRKITNKEAKPFNDLNHLQGHRNAQVTYGLYFKNELVQLMSFSFDKKHNWWEIIRGCPASNNVVVGGVSKLYKHFVNEYNPNKVFSYCDFNKFDGHGYEELGMKFIGYTGPDKKWIINGSVINRSAKNYKKYKQLAEAIVWGCGSKKYLSEF